MILGKNVKGLLEVFSIEAKNFRLWATLTSVKGGKSWVRGWVKLQDSDKSRFYRESMDPSALRMRLLSACGPIAAFYGSKLIHRKIQTVDQVNRDYSIMNPESRLVH